MRRKVILENQLDTSLNYAMDYEFWLRIAKEYRFKHNRAILAADRQHVKRKMITGAKALDAETKLVQLRYGARLGTLHETGRLIDKVATGSVRRLIGLQQFLQLHHRNDLAFDAVLDKVTTRVRRQIFTNDYQELIPLQSSDK
jgi:hypothetical protein